jgi:hypothetical protein
MMLDKALRDAEPRRDVEERVKANVLLVSNIRKRFYVCKPVIVVPQMGFDVRKVL